MSDLQVTSARGVLRLHIDREAKRNALSGDVLRPMLEALRAPGDARVVLVTSAGERVFCAGADLVQMAPDASGLEVHEGRGLLREVVLAMRACPGPVVASVQGLCLAGGVGLVLGCDLVLAADDALFGLPEVDLGLWPFMVSALLGRHVSPKRAMEMMLSARRVPAVEALEMGLVNTVVALEELEEETVRWAREMLALSPFALRLLKASFNAAEDGLSGIQQLAHDANLLFYMSEEAQEGRDAYREKRPADFTKFPKRP